MSPTPLCQLPTASQGGCGCGAAPGPVVVPATIDNAPGLASLAYRIGTFTTFRQAMLDRTPAHDLLANVPNPFAGWRPGADGDFQTFLIELWAYLADVLTFYQERIANEAYVQTATQRDSALRIVELIAYRPSPGAAASGVASFTVSPGKIVTVPAGFRISSRAEPGKQAAVFETSAAVTARAEHNAIALSSVAPVNQFAALTNIQLLYGGVGNAGLAAAAADLYGSAASTYVSTLSFLGFRAAVSEIAVASPVFQARSAAPALLQRAAFTGFTGGLATKATTLTAQGGDFTSHRYPFYSVTTRTIVLAGLNHRLNTGDYVLAVENGSTATLFQLSSVSTDKTANTTTLTWQETDAKKYDSSSQPVTLFALRVKAAPFGNDAPVNPDGSDLPGQTGSYVPAGVLIDLDGVYDAARGTAQNPGWVVLLAGGADPGTAASFQFSEARPVTALGYLLVKRVTRLTLSSGAVAASAFALRDTLVLTGSELLSLQNDLPLPDLLQGDSLILAGLYPNLQDGQAAIVQGNLYDATGATATPSAEFHTIKGKPLQDAANKLTTVQLDKPLSQQYSRSSTSLLANLVAFTQGETVADEVLGNGTGAPNQEFPLKKIPLTYLPSTDPESQSPVQSTVVVEVNGVRWEEKPTLLESDGGARQYSLTEDNSGQTTVVFGDGIHGAAPPTGVANVHASYRVGLGSSGNVAPGGVQQLLDSIAGLQQVGNPQSAAGGTDPESLDRIAVNAPGSVHAFNRAVSTSDYAALALTFPGIAKASTSWVAAGSAHPYVQLTVAAAGQPDITQTPLAAQLRDFLDQRRDVNVALRIVSFTPVYVSFAVTVDIQDQYPRKATVSAVEAALNAGINPDGSAGYFAFDRLDFGQSLHLSALYALVQSVPGVQDALITQFNLAGSQQPVANDILIGPTQIAVVMNDPSHPEQGLLTVTLGSGGFADA
jgi:uncharacterized phage protein gp47/JayE